MRIGVLAVQGAFAEHIAMLKGLGATCVEIRQVADLEGVEGIVLPGGESTVQGQLLHKLQLIEPLRTLIRQDMPVLATCAGLILLAEGIEGEAGCHLGTLPVTVRRNAYGRQLGSFVTTSDVGEIKNFPHVFIRAPYISALNSEVASDIRVVSEVDGRIVGVEYKNQLALAFHPEMTEDARVHQLFLDKVASWKDAKAKGVTINHE